MESAERQRELTDITVSNDNTIRLRRLGDDHLVGTLSFLIKNTPFEHYVLDRLNVERTEQGKGFSTQLLKEFERLCLENNMSAIVFDGISKERNPEAMGMYARRGGWKEIPGVYEAIGNHAFVFNLQDGQKPGDFVRMT